MMKLKGRLRWPGMSSHSMRSRASFTIGRTNLDGSLRTGESTLLNKDGSCDLCLLNDGIGGAGNFLYPLYSHVELVIFTHHADTAQGGVIWVNISRGTGVGAGSAHGINGTSDVGTIAVDAGISR
jgi:hypothetical protein